MTTIKDEACILLTGIELFGFHGHDAQERKDGNDFRVNLKIEGRFRGALKSDLLRDSIDYRQVVETIHKVNKAQQYKLIETFADAIVNELLERFPKITKLSLHLAKLSPPGMGAVSSAAIELVRVRQ
ncbi:dihydroneopterin aldolase [Candidatus Bipolaricaulota bacterium]|nr:dihydroneopterin aldolase [Candidatus Bipolaricaulota bacterium]